MDKKVVFTEKKATEKIENKTTAIRISKHTHRAVTKIATKTSLPAYEVADRLIAFALDHIHWEDANA